MRLCVDVPAQEVGPSRDAERLVERDAGEAERLQVLEDGEEDARAFEVASRFGVPSVREDGRHLPVVADRDELPVLAQKRGGRQRLGQPHLRSLVHHDEVEMLARPVHRAPLRRALLHQTVETARRPADDEQVSEKISHCSDASTLRRRRRAIALPRGNRVARVVEHLRELQTASGAKRRKPDEEGVQGRRKAVAKSVRLHPSDCLLLPLSDDCPTPFRTVGFA